MDCSDYQKHMSMLIDDELGQHSLQALEDTPCRLFGVPECLRAYGGTEQGLEGC